MRVRISVTSSMEWYQQKFKLFKKTALKKELKSAVNGGV